MFLIAIWRKIKGKGGGGGIRPHPAMIGAVVIIVAILACSFAPTATPMPMPQIVEVTRQVPATVVVTATPAPTATFAQALVPPVSATRDTRPAKLTEVQICSLAPNSLVYAKDDSYRKLQDQFVAFGKQNAVAVILSVWPATEGHCVILSQTYLAPSAGGPHSPYSEKNNEVYLYSKQLEAWLLTAGTIWRIGQPNCPDCGADVYSAKNFATSLGKFKFNTPVEITEISIGAVKAKGVAESGKEVEGYVSPFFFQQP